MQGEPYLSVLFPSRSKRKALLLFVVKLPDGPLEIINEGYLVRKTSKGWETIEGNGGIGMYERVARFVSDMERTPEYSLDRTIRAPKSCVSREKGTGKLGDIHDKQKSRRAGELSALRDSRSAVKELVWLAKSPRSFDAVKAAAWPDIHLREQLGGAVHED
jgi:hypothetical protein